MKLYSRPLSPYSARVRIALHHKQLAFETVQPEMGWGRDPAFLAINALGRIPVLILDDGTRLVESGVIVEWLDEAYPERSLLPVALLDRAKVRLVTQLAEHDVFATLMPLFGMFDASSRDPAAIEAAMTRLHTALGHLEGAMGGDGLAFGATLTAADAILTPLRYSLDGFVAFAKQPELLERYPRLRRYAEAVQAEPTLARVWKEMEDGLVAFMAWRAQQGKTL